MSIQQKVNVACAIGLAGVMAATPFLLVDRLSERAPSSEQYDVVEVYSNYSLPPCDEEDSTAKANGVDVPACIWDAPHRGNGQGRPFIVLSK